MLYTIYTDGSCLKNPGGPGGYAAVIFLEGEIIEELSGGEAITTWGMSSRRTDFYATELVIKNSLGDLKHIRV